MYYTTVCLERIIYNIIVECHTLTAEKDNRLCGSYPVPVCTNAMIVGLVQGDFVFFFVLF